MGEAEIVNGTSAELKLLRENRLREQVWVNIKNLRDVSFCLEEDGRQHYHVHDILFWSNNFSYNSFKNGALYGGALEAYDLATGTLEAREVK